MQAENKGVFRGNILFLILVIIDFPIYFIISGIEKLYGFELSSELNIIITQLSIIVPVIVYLLITEKNVFKFIRFKKINIWSAFLLIILAYCMWPLVSIINAISMLFATNMIQGTVTDIADSYSVGVAVFIIAVLPAIIEETTFRGALLNNYRKYNPLFAIIFSAVLFGLMHKNFNQMLYATAMGLIFGIVIEATDSIISTMIMHFVYNGTSVVITYGLPKLYEMVQGAAAENGLDTGAALDLASTEMSNSDLLLTMVVMIPFAVIGLVIGGLILYLIAKLNGREKYLLRLIKKDKTDVSTNTELKPKRSIKEMIITYVPLVVGMVVCLVMAIMYEIA